VVCGFTWRKSRRLVPSIAAVHGSVCRRGDKALAPLSPTLAEERATNANADHVGKRFGPCNRGVHAGDRVTNCCILFSAGVELPLITSCRSTSDSLTCTAAGGNEARCHFQCVPRFAGIPCSGGGRLVGTLRPEPSGRRRAPSSRRFFFWTRKPRVQASCFNQNSRDARWLVSRTCCAMGLRVSPLLWQ